jgi:putative inorganic carbon (HCO3(-)) transporter
MRDALLILIIVSGSLYALRQPAVGVILWTWVSLMNPHEQFGWSASQWPVAAIVAICTLIGLVATRDRQNPFQGSPVWLLLAFTLWICITLPFSIYFDESYPLWLRSIKIFAMIFVTLALLDTRRKLDWFIWITVVSLGYYGVKGGLFTIATGGNYIVWGPGGFIGGNNEVALALVMTIPLMRYLQQQASGPWIRLGLGGAMLLTASMVLGSHSRGALLALVAMTVVMWWKGNRKVGWGIALAAAGVVVLLVMPTEWWGRMETIGTYEQDASALGRINAWWMAWHLALDRFFGGGFMIWTGSVFRIYAPNPDDTHAAHSIYFQVLGEHGFVGLLLFLAVGISSWRAAGRLVRRYAKVPHTQWAADLGAMAQVSMVAYAVGGAFLSLAYFDLPYDVMVMVVIATRVVQHQAASAAAKQRAMPLPDRRPGQSLA